MLNAMINPTNVEPVEAALIEEIPSASIVTTLYDLIAAIQSIVDADDTPAVATVWVICAKLHHQNAQRCIFAQCGYQQRHAAQEEAGTIRTSGKANADHGSAIWGGSARFEGETLADNR